MHFPHEKHVHSTETPYAKLSGVQCARPAGCSFICSNIHFGPPL